MHRGLRGISQSVSDLPRVSLKDNHPLAFYLERWQKDGKIDLTINPFAIRPNYIILNWPLDELKITR